MDRMSGGKFLTPEEQIEHLKNKGITFAHYPESDAKHFLEEHTYLTKISAYRKNYSKHPAGEKAGQYINLDFGYLVELSTIDMHLRYLIITLCLNIEHALKISLLNAALDSPDEDGYSIVQHFLNRTPSFKETTERKMQQSYCRDLYFNNESNLNMWVLFEVLSFGDLIRFYKFYYEVHSDQVPPIDKRLLENVRNLRNACAHSNCLIADLNHKADTNQTLSNYMAQLPWLPKTLRKKYLRKQFTQDFTAFLIAHKILVKSEGIHSSTRKAIRQLFFQRMLRHRDYFDKNDIISGTYKYCFLLIKHYF